MNELPQERELGRRDAFYSLNLAPLEFMTKSLRTGDGWDLEELTPFVNRCRALVSAYDDRMERAKK